MKIVYFVLAVCFVLWLFRRLLRRAEREGMKKFENHPAVTGILEFRGNCVYVSPMALITSDDRDVDISKINTEALDKVVRLRIVEIVEAVCDPKRVYDEVEIDRLKRMATVHSALTGVHIHQKLMLIDHETKAMYVAIRHRLELVEPDRNEINKFSNYLVGNKFMMSRMTAMDYAVKLEFLQMLGKNEYDYFHIFATRVKRRVRKNVPNSAYTDEEVQSCITAHACMLGLMIPRSYIRYDEITSALVNWDYNEEEGGDQKVVYLKRS